MYSVVSASVLGLDLSRLPGGAAVSRVLRTALALRPADLPALAGAADDDAPAPVVARAAALDAARRLRRSPDGSPAVAEGLADAPRSDLALGLLDRAALGHGDALVRLVRDDVLGWTSRGPVDAREAVGGDPVAASAVEVVTDAAVAAYTTGVVEPDVTGALSARWEAARAVLPPPSTATGPCAERVEALLGRAARLGGADLERLEVAAEAARSLGAAREWAPAMHSATWAVHLAGRQEVAAVAQLRLVEALHGAVAVERLARGCWSTLSGAVQAEVVADLLDSATHDALAGGTLLALGLPD